MDALHWTDDALCREIDTELFFPEKGGEAPMTVQRAKTVCRACPVTTECLDYAMTFEGATFQRHGIYGGLSARERYALSKAYQPLNRKVGA